MPIREFIKGDETGCAEVVRKALEADKTLSKQELEWLVKHEAEGTYRKKAGSLDSIMLFEENEKILGVVGLKGNQLKPLYILPEHQNKGIGTKLAKAIEEKAKQKGVKKIWMEANPDAIKFYDRLGYKKVRNDIIKGTILEVAIMEKKLD
jgi:GNAT superfamily N-acetyltransferase